MPAERVRMHVFDAVHTRMGASDNLAMGRSTFLEVSVHAEQRYRTLSSFMPAKRVYRVLHKAMTQA